MQLYSTDWTQVFCNRSSVRLTKALWNALHQTQPPLERDIAWQITMSAFTLAKDYDNTCLYTHTGPCLDIDMLSSGTEFSLLLWSCWMQHIHLSWLDSVLGKTQPMQYMITQLNMRHTVATKEAYLCCAFQMLSFAWRVTACMWARKRDRAWAFRLSLNHALLAWRIRLTHVLEAQPRQKDWIAIAAARCLRRRTCWRIWLTLFLATKPRQTFWMLVAAVWRCDSVGLQGAASIRLGLRRGTSPHTCLQLLNPSFCLHAAAACLRYSHNMFESHAPLCMHNWYARYGELDNAVIIHDMYNKLI